MNEVIVGYMFTAICEEQAEKNSLSLQPQSEGAQRISNSMTASKFTPDDFDNLNTLC
jgi:hypothetical protein